MGEGLDVMIEFEFDLVILRLGSWIIRGNLWITYVGDVCYAVNHGLVTRVVIRMEVKFVIVDLMEYKGMLMHM